MIDVQTLYLVVSSPINIYDRRLSLHFVILSEHNVSSGRRLHSRCPQEIEPPRFEVEQDILSINAKQDSGWRSGDALRCRFE